MYVNDPIEAYYPGVYADGDSQTLDGSKHNYVLRFEAGQMPPVNAFWSTTMYDLEKRLMVANPINRYSIGDRTQGCSMAMTVRWRSISSTVHPGRRRNPIGCPRPTRHSTC